MTTLPKHGLLLPALLPLLLSACVSNSQLDTAFADNRKLFAENQQLRQQADADRQRIGHLEEAVRYTVNTDLLFPSGSWQITEAGKDIIAKAAKTLSSLQQEKIVVTGYTDDVPVSASLRQQGITSNEILSQKRAESVMQYMVSQGVSPDAITARGMGESNPVMPNTSGQNRAQNRRVEVTLAGPGS